MKNVSNLIVMESKKSKTVSLRYGVGVKEIDRELLFKFLLITSLKEGKLTRIWEKRFYNSTLKAFYYDAYDFIIRHFNDIDCIQIFNDNAIHLWSSDNHYCYSGVFAFEDCSFCEDELTSTMIKDLITFSENF